MATNIYERDFDLEDGYLTPNDPHVRVRALTLKIDRARVHRNVFLGITLTTGLILLLSLLYFRFYFLQPTVIIMDSDLVHFKQSVIAGVTKGPNNSTFDDSSWSGFARILSENNCYSYSASLKYITEEQPRNLKPVFQKQTLTGYRLVSIQILTALAGNTQIKRVQLNYQRN